MVRKICDFCGRPAIGRCMICDRWYCSHHKGARSYCYRCYTGTGLLEVEIREKFQPL